MGVELASPPERRQGMLSRARSAVVDWIAPLGVGIATLVVKRALSNPALVLFTLVGLVVSVSLVSAVPLYSDGVVEKLLRGELAKSSGQPPLAVRIRHQEDSQRPTTPSQYRRLDAYIAESGSSVVGLSLRNVVRFASVSSHRLHDYAQVNPTDVYIPSQARYAEIATLSQLAQHIRIVDGQGLPDGPSTSGEVPVILTTAAADELRMSVGERYWYVGPNPDKPEKLAIRVVGLWEATDPTNTDYWVNFLQDVTYNYTLFVNEADFFQNVLPAFPETPAIKEYSWYMVFSEAGMHSTKVERVRSGLRNLELDIARLMPDTKLDMNPYETLDWVGRQAALLRTLLLILSVPLLAVALYYVYVSLSMVMEQQRGEIAFLRSRGASPFQIVLIYLIESLISGAVALGAGLLVGIGVAQLIGKAFGFLQFAIRPPLPVYFGKQTIEYGLLAVALSIVCTIIPAVRAAQHSIVAHGRQATRAERLVNWPGLVFDAMAVAVAGYGYYSLKAGTPIARLGASGDYLVEPLLLLLPAVFICALALLFRRFVPLLGAITAHLVERVAGAPALLALRQLYRAPSGHSALVFLLVVTLAIGIFSASAARTLESNYTDRARYGAPADLELANNWEYDPDAGGFLEPPLGALEVPGVRAVTRTQAYTAKPGGARGGADIQVLGIDRDTFAEVSWWRRDFAHIPLGALVNALSVSDNAAIVSPSYLQQYQMRLGDSTQLSFQFAGQLDSKLVDFLIVDSADYFPTLYPERGPFFVANLDYLHDQLGLGMYDVWLAIDPAVKTSRIVDAITANGITINRIKDQRVVVNVGRLDPQRTGILGLLSLAFIVAAMLTVFGFFLHMLLSFQRRTPQLGVLRTMGLSRGQLVRLLLIEQSFVVVLSVVAGIGFGTLASQLFIPFLQVDVDRLGATPPFVIQPVWGDVAWICLILGVMLGVGVLATLWLIRHMQLNQAIQLGGHV